MKARVILAVLSFFLFFVTQMNRVNINIAIVTMEDSYLGNNWDAKVIILGAYYWCYSLIELPGTFFLRKYGCRKILAINLFLSGIANFAFPSLYKYHPICGIVTRALQGLLLGITWPAAAVLSAKWIPRQERSKFTSTYQGSAVGQSVTNALGGIVIYNLGWPYIFYSTGVLSILWAIFWCLYGYNSPAEHPRISEDEKIYIQKAIGENNNHNQSIPWVDIFMSKPFWAVFIGTFGIMWFIVTISMQLPTYLHTVHQVDIRTNGFLLFIPDIFSYVFSLSISILIDKQIINDTMSITNARKFATVFSHVVPAALLVFLSVYGVNNVSLAMVFIVIAVASGGATSSGNLANIVDISPKNGGIIMGICKSLCLIPGIMSPIIVKYFTAEHPTNWLPVFTITSAILIFTSLFYFIYGSGEIQYWDQKNDREVEMVPMERNSLMESKPSHKFIEESYNELNIENKNLINEKKIPQIDLEIGKRC